MTDVDIIVVGAGVAGLTAARLLASAGQRALVLEALREIYATGSCLPQACASLAGRTHRAAENVLGRRLPIDDLWVGVEGIEPPTSSL